MEQVSAPTASNRIVDSTPPMSKAVPTNPYNGDDNAEIMILPASAWMPIRTHAPRE